MSQSPLWTGPALPSLGGPPLVELQAVAREACSHEVVEDEPVLLGRLVVEGLCKSVSHLDEGVATGVHKVDELALELLGFVAIGAVVGGEGFLHLGEQLGLLVAEERELAPDHLLEATIRAQREISA
ncbi:MAG: hypothetical protein ABI649_10775 [Gaiellaceae bacterium]